MGLKQGRCQARGWSQGPGVNRLLCACGQGTQPLGRAISPVPSGSLHIPAGGCSIAHATAGNAAGQSRLCAQICASSLFTTPSQTQHKMPPFSFVCVCLSPTDPDARLPLARVFCRACII